MADVDTPPQSDPLAAGLIDIPLPAPPSLWPQTWTARITLALAAALLIVGIWRVAHWWRANRYRRAAMAELDRIEQAAGEQPAAGLATKLALLVRRTALSAFPREEIAALAGPAWLAFLDRSYGGHEFSAGPGRCLAAAPYEPTPVAHAQVGALIDLVRRWIRTHHD
jgi:Domain of unknown function (DUF4381)